MCIRDSLGVGRARPDARAAGRVGGRVRPGDALSALSGRPVQRRQAVSYTHLDVYKRQELLGPDGVGSNRPVLVPNIRGLDRALEAGCQAIAIFGSATETFAQRNLGRSIAESVAMFAPVVERARAEGLWVRAYVSMCFGDPWEGDVPVGQVVDAARRLMDLGCDELSLGDTCLLYTSRCV